MPITNILFVDDDPRDLQLFQQLMRGSRPDWQLLFANSSRQALEMMDQKRIDMVVADLLMPDMNGAQLLTEVKSRHAQIIRIAAAGDSEREMALRLLCPAHQCLTKPCNAPALKETINRAFALRNLLTDEKLKRLVSQMHSLPGLPSLYMQLLEELRKQDPSMVRVGEIISHDIGMTAKILQLVNSAFFGLPRKMANTSEAVMYLGFDTIRTLVLSVQVFSQFSHSPIKEFSLEALWQHSWSTGCLAKKIARAENLDEKLTDQCSTAALLHDVGKLILVCNMTDKYRPVLQISQQKKQPIWQVEQEILGTTYAAVGACLLGLWGLPNPILEGVAFHNYPDRCDMQTLSVATVVHVADRLAREKESNDPTNPDLQIAENHLKVLGLEGHLDQWRKICSEEEEAL